MTIDDSYNFRRIDERVTTSGLVTPEQFGSLRAEGYDAVIHLLPDSYEHAVAHEDRIVRDQGMDYVYIPVDFDAPTKADLEAFVDAMDSHADQKIHVHCAANYRVSAFYGLYAQRKGRWTEGEADELICSIWDPGDFPAWATFLSDERADLQQGWPRH